MAVRFFRFRIRGPGGKDAEIQFVLYLNFKCFYYVVVQEKETIFVQEENESCSEVDSITRI